MGSSAKQDSLWLGVGLGLLRGREDKQGLRCLSLMLANWLPCLGVPVPTALATALDVGLSNWSFLYITVSL